tara:strand:- start:32 stop:208 length:177 start_codon:yes stop_codon:yes gene_type:complete
MEEETFERQIESVKDRAAYLLARVDGGVAHGPDRVVEAMKVVVMMEQVRMLEILRMPR